MRYHQQHCKEVEAQCITLVWWCWQRLLRVKRITLMISLLLLPLSLSAILLSTLNTCLWFFFIIDYYSWLIIIILGCCMRTGGMNCGARVSCTLIMYLFPSFYHFFYSYFPLFFLLIIINNNKGNSIWGGTHVHSPKMARCLWRRERKVSHQIQWPSFHHWYHNSLFLIMPFYNNNNNNNSNKNNYKQNIVDAEIFFSNNFL